MGDGKGVFCEGPWSSDLHVCSVFPGLGGLLLARATRDWPFSLHPRTHRGDPEITFVLPFAGTAGGTRVVAIYAERLLSDLREFVQPARREGVAVRVEVEEGDPATAILQRAQTGQADLVVLGTRGRIGLPAGLPPGRIIAAPPRPPEARSWPRRHGPQPDPRASL